MRTSPRPRNVLFVLRAVLTSPSHERSPYWLRSCTQVSDEKLVSGKHAWMASKAAADRGAIFVAMNARPRIKGAWVYTFIADIERGTLIWVANVGGAFASMELGVSCTKDV